ncbi:MAG: addiction module protein [Planctomycetes bacterium]|nr:addiction module protein [Planctomycetota bacterium]MBM4081843.1 addiction module protein [Planctomycetota bacterium]MBM4085115.1 addiction module protein [Planctomycetota bacterium]
MTRAAQAVLDRALRLNPVERATLIEKLYRSFDGAERRKADRRWAAEAESRIDAYEAGEIEADSAEAVLKRNSKR